MAEIINICDPAPFEKEQQEGPSEPALLPHVGFVSPWEAAQWRAFDTIVPLGALIPRSFDQGAVKLPDEAANTHTDRVGWHNRFDAAEQEVRRALALGRLSAKGRRPIKKDSRRIAFPEPEHNDIPAATFQNCELAFSPTGELILRATTLEALFPDHRVRDTNADPGIPLYYDVQIPTHELRALWQSEHRATPDLLAEVALEPASELRRHADVSPGTAAPKPEPYLKRSGTQGRPSSMNNLILPELERRRLAGETLLTLRAESEALSDWLRQVHPAAPQAGAKGVRNSAGEKLREAVSEAKARNRDPK